VATSCEILIASAKFLAALATRKAQFRTLALESGSNIDLDEHLERELSPISLSIAAPKGRLRKPSVKFDLGKILQENDCQS